MFRSRLFLSVLLAFGLAAVAVPSAGAQTPTFATLVQQGLSGNQDLSQQIKSALGPGDLMAVKTQSSTALGTANGVLSALDQALPMAPDDASRSRIEGLRGHIRATAAPLSQAAQANTPDEARARLDQARGEADESLAEFQPFAAAFVAQLPKSGGLSDVVLSVVAAFGGSLTLAGALLRRVSRLPGRLALRRPPPAAGLASAYEPGSVLPVT